MHRRRRHGGRLGNWGHSHEYKALTLRSRCSHRSRVYFWSCRPAAVPGSQRRAPTRTRIPNPLLIIPTFPSERQSDPGSGLFIQDT